MEVILHLPDTAEAVEELNQSVAKVHAELAVEGIHRLPCPDQQKYQLIQAMLAEGHQKYTSSKECLAP